MFTPLTFLSSLVISLIFAASAAALGMIIASVSRTAAAANWIGVVVTMFMVMVGGTFFEITKGTLLETLSKVSLNTYANEAYREIISRGGSLGEVWQPLAVLVGVAIVGLIISRIIFRAVPGSK
jgi:ABC-type multidrug transport system permease subunit